LPRNSIGKRCSSLAAKQPNATRAMPPQSITNECRRYSVARTRRRKIVECSILYRQGARGERNLFGRVSCSIDPAAACVIGK
jgi:hypothetical protein